MLMRILIFLPFKVRIGPKDYWCVCVCNTPASNKKTKQTNRQTDSKTDGYSIYKQRNCTLRVYIIGICIFYVGTSMFLFKSYRYSHHFKCARAFRVYFAGDYYVQYSQVSTHYNNIIHIGTCL